MFSFFRRGKSKDDSEKKEKFKDKSFSPFSKRQDSNKKEPTGSCSTNQSFRDSSLTPGPSDPQTPKVGPENSPQDTLTTLNDHTETHHTNQRQPNLTDIIQPHVETPKTDKVCILKDEQQYLVNSSDSQTVTVSTLSSPAVYVSVDKEQSESDRSGSSERDIVYKTAPNTPVLSKHLEVTGELIVDTPDLVSDCQGLCLSLGTDLNFPCADGEESSDVESKVIVLEDSDSTQLENLNGESGQEFIEDRSLLEEDSARMCEEMSHGPGELYDIAEEETSEDEEESEPDEDDDDDDEDSGNVTQPTIEEEYPEEIVKKNLVNQEAQFQELTTRLYTREVESNRLLGQVETLQRDIMVKTCGMDRLQAELNAAHKESELVKKRVRKLEEDLDSLKQKNSDLTEELEKRSEGFDFNHLLELEEEVKELTLKVQDLEGQVTQMKQERDRLEREAKEIQEGREEENRIIQEALDEALTEKIAIQTRFERDFERLRTVNTDREQQLLDDFEWKLREVEQACKRRLEDKEKSAKQRIKDVEDKLKAAENDLAQVESLRQFEVEATQLRGLNLEQQRALRQAERTKEELQVSEKVLREEVKKMKELLEKEKSALTTMQAIHNREIDEKERKMKFRLEQQKTELNTQWEEKLRKETLRLRVELDQMNRDEKRVILEVSRAEKEAELLNAKEEWDKNFQKVVKEVELLKQKLAHKEEEHKENVETFRTNADRDIFELRRKLDRIDITYQEKIERLEKEHEQEKDKLLEESERKLQSCEQNYQLQLGSTRTTLELVKEQLKREAEEKIQALHDNHRRQLEEQWEQLTQERDEAMAMMEARHRSTTEKMRADLETAYKSRNTREQELVDLVNKMRQEISGKTSLIEDLSTQTESLKDNVEELNRNITNHDKNFQQTKEEAETKLRLVEDRHKQVCLELVTSHEKDVEKWRTAAEQLKAKLTELTKRLEESTDSKLVEDLRKALSDKEQQVAQLSKEKHLYQLELMNRNSNGESVTARQRRKGGRAKANKPGPSRK